MSMSLNEPPVEARHFRRRSWSLALVVLLDACSLLPAGGQAPPPRAGVPVAYREALRFIAEGRDDEAEPRLEALVAERPALAGAWLNLGLLYERLDRPEAARAVLQQALRVRPALAPAYNALGILARKDGDFAAARVAYESAIAADPAYARAELNLGILCDLYLARPVEALGHYRRFLALAGDDETVQQWVAELEQRTARGRTGQGSGS